MHVFEVDENGEEMYSIYANCEKINGTVFLFMDISEQKDTEHATGKAKLFKKIFNSSILKYHTGSQSSASAISARHIFNDTDFLRTLKNIPLR